MLALRSLARAIGLVLVPLPSVLAQAPAADDLATHPYLSDRKWTVVEGPPPLRSIVVLPPGRPEAEARTRAARAAALVEPTLLRFEREFLLPLDLARREALFPLTLLVLPSRSEYEAYRRVVPRLWHHDTVSTFDPELHAAVFLVDPGLTPPLQAEYAAHAFVHLLEEAHAADDLRPSWLLEGLANVLARPPVAGRSAAPDRDALRLLVESALDPDLAWLELRTVEELCHVGDPAHLESFLRARTADEGLLDGLDRFAAWTAFSRQAALLVQYLLEGDDGRWHDGLVRFTGRVLAGQDDLATLLDCLGLDDPAAVDRGFLAWIVARYREAYLSQAIDEARVLAALDPPRGAADGSPSVAPEVARARLDLDRLEPTERFALALCDVRAGRLGDARARLEALASAADGPPGLAARARQELARVTTWAAARRAFLAALASDGGRLDLETDGKRQRLRVRALEADRLVLEDGRDGTLELALEALDSAAIARQMSSDEVEPRWVRCYPFVVAGDDRWRRLLKSDGPEAEALAADARDDYPARLELADVVGRLAALARAPRPETPAETRALVAEARALLATSHPTVERLRTDLRGSAEGWLERELELVGRWTPLVGSVEPLEEGRVRLTWEFDDPRELQDFDPTVYPVLIAKGLAAPETADGPFQVRGGRAESQGRATLRSLVDVAAPMVVRTTFRFDDAQHRDGADYVTLGLCDDGNEHFLWSINLQSLLRYEADGGDRALGEQLPMYLGTDYAIEVAHEGTTVVLSAEGRELVRLAPGGRRAGAFFLFGSSSNPLSIERLEVEGHVDEQGLERLGRAWIARQLDGE